MLRLEYLLLITKIFLVAFGRLKDDLGCSDGVAYEGFCFDKCPSGFVEYNRDCKPLAGQAIFDVSSSKARYDEEFLGLKQSSPSLPEKDHPILTSSQGYFFKKNSKFFVLGPKIFSYKMTISMYLYLYEDGNLVSNSKNNISFLSENSIFSLFYFGRSVIENHFFQDMQRKWKLLYMGIEFLPNQYVNFYVKFGEIQINKQIYISQFPDFDGLDWIIGDKNDEGQGFLGFVYRIEFYNYLVEPGELPYVQDCGIDKDIIENCETSESIDSICSYKKGRLLTTYCLDHPTCSLNPITPPLFYEVYTTYYTRVAETQKSSLLYYFDTTENNIIEADYANYQLVTSQTTTKTPRGAFKRGKYLNNLHGYYTTNPGIDLSLSPSFFFWLKLEAPDYLPVLATNVCKIYASQSGHFIWFNKWIMFQDVSLIQSTWNLVKYSFFYTVATSVTTLKISINQSLKFTYDLTGHRFSSTSTIIIGYDDEANFVGWIYCFGYSDSNTNLQMTTERATNCIYNGESDAKCEINCNMTSYFEGTTCKLCPSNSLSCKSSTECGLCYDNTCNNCKSSSSPFCSICEDFFADKFCLLECPLLYVDSGDGLNCNRTSTDWIDIKLDSSTGLTVSPALFTLEAFGDPAAYFPSRGYFFSNNSNYQSSSSFKLHPMYTLQVWVKFITGDDLQVLYGDKGLDIVGSKIRNPITSALIVLQDIVYWSHFKMKLYLNSGSVTFQFIKDSSLVGMNSTILVNGALSSFSNNWISSKFTILSSEFTSVLLYKIRYNVDGIFYDLNPNEPLCGQNYCLDCELSYFIGDNQCLSCPTACLICSSATKCTYFGPGCFLLLEKCFNPCPQFYELVEGVCSISEVNKMVFVFDTLNGIIPDSIGNTISLDTISKNAYPSIVYTSDPIPSSNRGFFFGRSASTKMQTSVMLTFSPEFFFGIWLMPLTHSGIAQKGDTFLLSTTETGAKIKITYPDTQSFEKTSTDSISLGSWVFIGVSIYYDKATPLTHSNIFTNSAKQTFSINSEVLVDYSSLLVIGEANVNYFAGWIYKVIYSGVPWTQSDINSELGTCSGCSCPKTLNKCLPTCYFNQYYQFGQCKDCEGGNICKALGDISLCFDSESCSACNDFKTCKTCTVATCKTACDPSCKTCSSPSLLDCESCSDSYYHYLGICLSACADLTSISGSDCVLDSTINLNYNFHTSMNTVSDSLNKLTFEASPKLYLPNRGWYTQLATSTGNLVMTPYPSLFLWVKLTAVGQFIIKKNSSGQVEFAIELNADNTFKIIENTSKGFMNSLDINVNGIQPFDWKYFVVVYEALGAFSKRYFYVDSVQVNTDPLVDKYIVPIANSKFEIGNNSPMYLHQFRYSASFDKSYLASTFTTGASCIFPQSFSNCLWNCPLNAFFDGQICKPCFIASTCSGNLYSDYITCFTNLNGFCALTCPTFHTNTSSTCTLSSEYSLDFIFSKFDGTTPSTNNLFTLVNPGSTNYPNFLDTDPKPGFNRGFYFSDSWLQTTANLEFSNTFTLEFWVNFNSLSNLVVRSKFELAMVNGGINVKMNLMDSVEFSLKANNAGVGLNKWIYLGVVLTEGRTVKIYLGESLIGDLELSGYFLDILEPLKFGGQQSNSFKGWIYRIKYTATALNLDQLIIKTESAPDLWNCRFGYVYHLNACASCKNQCNCRRPTDCSLCKSENCKLCSSYTSICSECFEGFEYFSESDACKAGSNRCQDTKFNLNECSTCKDGFVKYSNEACLLYCSIGDTLNTGVCSRVESTIMSFVFNKVNLPFESNGFELVLGANSNYWPSYDLADPVVSYQRGLYFDKSLLQVSNNADINKLKLGNWQTFEIYFFAREGQGSLLTYFSDKGKVISVMLLGNYIDISYQITDTVESATLTSLLVSFTLNTWTRLTWTLEPSLNLIKLKTYKEANLIETSTAFNYVFDQPLNNSLLIGSYKKAEYFKGYIYSFSVYNYVKTPPNSFIGCTCPYCTTSGDCLINCDQSEYFNSSCQKCPQKCSKGCGQGLSCSVYSNALCASFNFLNQPCLACVEGTKPNKLPCECVDGATFNKETIKCECPNGDFIYEGKCDPCLRYLKESEIKSYFLENFLQVSFEFSIPVVQIKCTDLFTAATLAKLGKDFECKFSGDFKALTVTMGVGFTLLNESISLNLLNLQGSKRECGYSFQQFNVFVRYLNDPPAPEAIINAISPVNINCQDLIIDGSQSRGQLLAGLEYRWEFISNIPELQNYPKEYSKNPYISLSNTKLTTETLAVKLTVRNRFLIENSATESIILTKESILNIKFDKLIDYSCLFSQTCQFFIKDIETCIKVPKYKYVWEIKTEGLGLNETLITEFWKSQLAPESLTIPPKLFPYSEIEFSVTVTEETSLSSGTDSIAILIKPDPLDIILDRAPGPISDDEDFIITPSIPSDSNKNTKISFEWECFLDSVSCAFPYEKNNKVLKILKTFVKSRLLNRCVLTINSVTSLQRRLESKEIVTSTVVEFECKIVAGKVPSVNLFKSDTLNQPKFVTGQISQNFEAVVKDVDLKDYSFSWKIDNVDSKVFLSPVNQIKVGIDMTMLVKGNSYKLEFELVDSSKQSYKFSYDFTVNTPPKFGICKVTPEEGEEQSTLFSISCADWKDNEGNVPLSYSFGTYINESPNFFVSVSPTSSFSTKLAYTSASIIIFSRIIDSIGDYTEVKNTISLKISSTFDPGSYIGEASGLLESSSITSLPNAILNIALLTLNRDLYTEGEFKPQTNETTESMNNVFTLLTDSLNSIILNSIPSIETVTTVAGILQEITKNPLLSTEENFISSSKTITDLLYRTKEVGLTVDSATSLLTSIDSLAKVDPETLYNNTGKVYLIETLFTDISDGLKKSSIPNKPTEVNSGTMSLKLYSLDKTNSADSYQLKVGGVDSTLPAELLSKFSDLSKIIIFTGHSDSINDTTSSTPTTTFISISSKDSSEIFPIQLENSKITIVIPVYNTKVIKEPGCFYLNSTKQWDKTGCSVLEVAENSITCECTHLSLFSSGEGVEGGGFAPSSNIEQTVDFNALANINAQSAIGFYFISVLLALYFVIGFIAWRKDSRDIQAYIEEVDRISANQLMEEDHQISQNSLVNEGQILQEHEEVPRIQRQLANQIEEITKNTKTGFKIVIEEHRLLSIFFHHDPVTFRFTRTSLLFLLFTGKMYFIGLFYESEPKNSKVNSAKDALISYSLRDFLVMIYSIGIVISMDILLLYLTKIKSIDTSLPREAVLKHIRFNKIKRIVALVFCCGIMVFYCWSIAMFALHLEYSVSIKWVINTAIGIVSDLTVSPLIKLFVKGFILSKILLYLKLRSLKRKVLPSTEKSGNDEMERSDGGMTK